MRHFAVLLFSISCALYGDTLVLRNGRTVSGSYLGGDSRNIRMAVGDRVETHEVADVVRVEFGSGGSAATAPAAPANDARGLRTDRNPPAVSEGAGIEVPAGTSIAIRMIDPVDSRTDKVGQTYRASLDEPVMVNGTVVIPRGTDVTAKLVDDKQSGRMTGQTVLTIDLESITLQGRVIPLATEEVTRASGSRTKKTGVATGGLAALGAAIGGIAGGGKGAAIGAVSGAGAGAASTVMMKGEQVKIPSETRLTFNLQQPLRI